MARRRRGVSLDTSIYHEEPVPVVDKVIKVNEIKEIKPLSTYQTKFEYDSLNLETEEVKELKKIEEEVFFLQGKGSENVEKIKSLMIETKELKLRLIKAVHKAKEILPKDGTFGSWCETVGLNRNKVYEISLNERIAEKFSKELEELITIPVDIKKKIASEDSSFSETEVIEILEAEKPRKVFNSIIKKKVNLSEISDKLFKVAKSFEKSYSIKENEDRLKERMKVLKSLKKQISLIEDLINEEAIS